MSAIVEVTSVSKSFGTKVLDDLSLTVGAGDAVGIVGPNGAGKTTLLNIIAGDLFADAGTVRFDGHDVTHLRSDRRCRAGLARTAQIPRPFEAMTVFENVLVAAVFGAGTPTSEREGGRSVVEALRRTELLDHANVPAGALGLLDRKRLELARALATSPRVLLLDEIAGGLTENEVLHLVDTVRGIYRSGITIVWIEHIVHALMRVVDHMVAISFGAKIAEGDPHEVMASPEVRDVYLGVGVE